MRAGSIAAGLAAVVAVAGASAQERSAGAEAAASAHPAPAPLLPSPSTSVGGPADGHLVDGVPLPASGTGFRSNARRPNPEAYYGTAETIRAIVRAAAAVDRALPGSELVVNDIGLPGGGPIHHHGSHQAGRDADILFYYLDREGAPLPAKGIPVDRRGLGWDFADLRDPHDDVRARLDLPRTWRFVQALLEDDLAGEGGLVQRIFVVEHVRALLLEEAARARAPRAVVVRFSDVTCQPGVPHDDHLHVRFFCSDDDLAHGCADAPPMMPWRRAQLRAVGLQPVMSHPRRRDESRTTSPEDAVRAAEREAGGRLPARVRAFLADRATWTAAPHPGRPYCR